MPQLRPGEAKKKKKKPTHMHTTNISSTKKKVKNINSSSYHLPSTSKGARDAGLVMPIIPPVLGSVAGS